MNKLVTAMHDVTHLVPGVPAHDDVTQSSHPARAVLSVPDRSPHRHDHSQRHQKPPRVLVGWQNWIAQLGGDHDAEH